jgi:hypothetical protein
MDELRTILKKLVLLSEALKNLAPKISTISMEQAS